MKKVLVITYDFPPIGKGNILRPFKFSKYFLRNDWQPVVLTSTPKSYYFSDPSLLVEAERLGIEIHRTKGSKKNLLTGRKLKELPHEKPRKFRRNISRLTNIPDEHEGWIKKAVKLGSEIIESQKIEIIYTTAPPFSAFHG